MLQRKHYASFNHAITRQIKPNSLVQLLMERTSLFYPYILKAQGCCNMPHLLSSTTKRDLQMHTGIHDHPSLVHTSSEFIFITSSLSIVPKNGIPSISQLQ